jgi:hypothetical protein
MLGSAREFRSEDKPMTTISRIQTTAPTTATPPSARPKPTMAQMMGTGFTNLRRDHVATAQPAGKALTRVSFGDRWKTLESLEKVSVGITGTIGTLATIGMAVAGAKGAYIGRGGIKGALIGAGVGFGSAMLATMVTDAMFSYGSMAVTKGTA